MRPSQRVTYKLTARNGDPTTARSIISREFSGRVPAGMLQRLQLLVTELVTQRSRQLSPGDELTLDLRTNGNVRCSVVDEGAAELPGGRTAAFLDRFADSWGVTRTGKRTCSWFELRAGAAG